MDIGSKIRAIRKEHNLSQVQLAEKYHVTRQTVSNWENNKNYPDMGTLKQISDDFHLSFDTLLKDDTQWMGEIDQTKKRAVNRKRIIIVLILMLCTMLAGFYWFICDAFQGTDDGDRVNTDSNVRMLVNIPGAAPSRAITYTLEAGENTDKFQIKQAELKEAALGRIEGDIPAVFTSENPKVTLYFQDNDYNNLQPKMITSVKAELENLVSLEKSERQLDYKYKDGKIILQFSPDFVTYAKNDTDWYDCVITVEYMINGQKYISITALTLMEDHEIDW